MIRGMLLLLAAMVFVQPADPVRTIGFAQETVLKHRIGSGEIIAEVPPNRRGYYGDLNVRITIATDGTVTDARVDPDDNHSGMDPAPAIAAARKLKFRPFAYRGAPVAAMGTVQVHYVMGGDTAWRDPGAKFPPIDYAKLEITLTRSACFGNCPDYQVKIDGAGNVEFSTREDSLPGAAEVHRQFSMGRGVLVPGTHRTKISREALDALIDRFRAARFFGLKQSYVASVTDSATYVVRLRNGGLGWTVTDYVGAYVGMPPLLTELEDAIDETAGTARWIEGDAGTVPALIAEGFDPRGEDAQQMALASAQFVNGRVAADLVAAGLPLDALVAAPEENDRDRKLPLGRALLEAAAKHSQPALFAALSEKGWLARMPRDALGILFAESGGGCDAGIARALVAAGADPNARTPRDPTDQSYSHGERNALMTVLNEYRCRDAQTPEYVGVLLGLGVDINAVDQRGESAIFSVRDADVLELLLTSGARVDIKNRDGNSAALETWTDATALRLLEAGADPHGTVEYNGRKTLRQMAQGDMPGVIVWLDAHGIT